MAGHSKWAQIKRKKAVTDAQKGRVFSKFAKEIAIAARGNPDPKTNIRLKSVVEKARSFNMPNDSIERALKRVADRSAGELEELSVEALGPGGIALIITAITDSRNRTLTELKMLLGRHGARMVGQNSLAWMFKQSRGRDGSLIFEPTAPIPVADQYQQQLEGLYNELDEHDDVQEVFTNEQTQDDTGN